MKTNIVTNLRAALLCMFCSIFLADFAKADLLGVNPGYPKVTFVSPSVTAVTYDPGTHVFTVEAAPTGIEFTALDSGILIVSNRSVQIMLDNSGAMLSGANGFTLTGEFTQVVSGVTNVYSGVLLHGDVLAFGALDSGATDQYDFRVHITSGLIASFFTCGDLAINLTSEESTFAGSFDVEFRGAAKGFMGPEDLTPPTIICPPNAQVITTPATNDNVPGFIITYPDPMVSDNCDPTPMVLAFDDSFNPVPSGTFVALNAGDSLTITLYAIDASGNYCFCSFIVVMQEPDLSGPIDFGGFVCDPATLCNDAGKCYATYTFPQPVATNSAGQMFPAMATAVDQGGIMIALVNLGNGSFLGQFPRTTGGTNVITFSASDGQGNSVVQQCHVFVNDCEAPTIVCEDQAGAFKPIMTTAFSCIDATFNNTPIAASNYIWFNNAIRIPQDGGNSSFTVHIFDQTISLAVNNTNLTVPVPESYVTFSNGVAIASTTFSNGAWMTVASPKFGGNTFASGVTWQVPFDLNSHFGKPPGHNHDDGPSRGVKAAVWCARFAVDKPGVVVQWQWAAAVYSTFSNNPNALGVKPVDGNVANAYQNSDRAGTPENFKPYVIGGARGGGGKNWTGSYSDTKRANLGMGTVCEGAVNFMPPLAADNCDNSVMVTCDPPSGSIFGPGDHTITSTAVDASGNTNQCSFTLTVLAPIQVVFDSPCSDNLADNSCSPDAGFNDMNCPDDPSTPQVINRFSVGDRICHAVRLVDCNGQDVTSELAGSVTVHLDVTERAGSYWTGSLVADVPQNFSGIGSPGGILVPGGGQFRYTLNTAGYEAGTVNGPRFFRSCVWVEYNTSPGIPVGMEDVILESR